MILMQWAAPTVSRLDILRQLDRFARRARAYAGIVALAIRPQHDALTRTQPATLDAAHSSDKNKVPADNERQRVLSVFDFFTREEGFTGNREEYYNPANSFLHNVLKRRMGIPISLSIVLIAIARRLGTRQRRARCGSEHDIGLLIQCIHRQASRSSRCRLRGTS